MHKEAMKALQSGHIVNFGKAVKPVLQQKIADRIESRKSELFEKKDPGGNILGDTKNPGTGGDHQLDESGVGADYKLQPADDVEATTYKARSEMEQKAVDMHKIQKKDFMNYPDFIFKGGKMTTEKGTGQGEKGIVSQGTSSLSTFNHNGSTSQTPQRRGDKR